MPGRFLRSATRSAKNCCQRETGSCRKLGKQRGFIDVTIDIEPLRKELGRKSVDEDVVTQAEENDLKEIPQIGEQAGAVLAAIKEAAKLGSLASALA